MRRDNPTPSTTLDTSWPQLETHARAFCVDFSYYPGGYYQPAAAGPLLPQPIAQTCLLAHHIPVRVPHAQVKVLIHNPDTPHDLAAFSERTYTGKSSDSNNNSSSVNNDIGNISNKNSGSVRGNSASKYSETDVSVITSSNSKKRTSTDNSKSKNVSGKKSAESRVELKNRDVEKACKRKYEKRKAKVTKTEVEVKEEKEVKREEPEVPDHGWRWIGEPEVKKIPSVNADMPPVERRCYSAIRHIDGDVIFSRDCVLLRSGSRKSDVPYVAKVAAFWEHPESGEMMMSLLWYYQPEHTEAGRQAHDLESEVFASRHWDENSVACIDDKCYVLTYDQYCRYQGEMRRHENNALPRSKVVPILEMFEGSQYNRELPDHDVDPENVFMCRKVYDFRQKRILKNPS
ncbi:hypothetical protein C0Q70_07763 [Pomacea canaliculata]|uniref:BAH domain-containing protein n=1 Tax=Pomacea canaliculata TaxID=400727 RepID=A0A2T7PG31_POMCA|nr:hypothetical protein C0Q70_07763 [Pomacea canaliculata]